MRKTDKLKNIESANISLLTENYGGGTFKLPATHKAGLRVPKGGSCCANCKFWNSDKKECENENFIKWNGNGEIPHPANEYCTDWYIPKQS